MHVPGAIGDCTDANTGRLLSIEIGVINKILPDGILQEGVDKKGIVKARCPDREAAVCKDPVRLVDLGKRLLFPVHQGIPDCPLNQRVELFLRLVP